MAQAQPLLTLDDAIKELLQKNYDVLLAKNDAEISHIQNDWAVAGKLPTVNVNGSYNFSLTNLNQKLNTGVEINRNGATQQSEILNVLGSWKVYNGGKVLATKKRLEQLETIGNLQVRNQANESVYNLVSSYLVLVNLYQQLHSLDSSLILFKDRMDLAENKWKIGVSAKSDFLQAEVDMKEQQSARLSLENSMAQTKASINNLLGKNPDENFTISEELPPVILPNRSVILSSLDSLNPQLLIARSNLQVLMQNAKEINAQRLPSLGLNMGLGLNNSNNSAGLTLQNTSYGPTAGISVGVPLFLGGVVKKQLQVNGILQKENALQFDQLKNNLATILANAYNRYENAKKQYNLEQANLQLVKENNMIAMERFRKANITTVELRQTQINLVQSETRLFNSLYQMKQAEADVLLVTGKLVQ